MTNLPPSDLPPSFPGPGTGFGAGGQGNDPPSMQQFRHNQVAARIPERVGRGVYATGVIVMRSNTEFVLDFVQRMSRPHQVAARVVVPFAVAGQFVDALRRNLDSYTERWGPPKEPPRPNPPPQPPSFQEIYDDLKVSDDTLSGAYANAMMVTHSPSDFCFDFVTTFFPNSAVSCRVFLSAGQVPAFYNSLSSSYQHLRQAPPGNPGPGSGPGTPPAPGNPGPFNSPGTPPEGPML